MMGESNGGACESSKTSREPVASPSRAGEARGEARAILAVLSERNIPISEALKAKVLACRDLATLEQWVRRAAKAASAEDALQ